MPTAQFDPDQFMASRAPAFDPDQFMTERQAQPYNASQRGAKAKGTPAGLPDTFMGTLTKDFAGIPEGVANVVAHPIDTAVAAFHQIMSLPHDVVQDVSQGKWGKLAARAAELAAPAIGTETGGALAGRAGAQVGRAASAAGAGVSEGLSDFSLIHPFSPKPLLTAAKGAVEDFRANPVPPTPVYPDLSARKPAWVGMPQSAPAPAASLEPITPIITRRTPPSAVRPPIAPVGPPEDTALLDGIAQGQTGKAFRNLSPDEQTGVRELAQRLQSPPAATAPAPRPQPIRPPAAAPVTTSSAPGKTIADIAREELTHAPSAPPEGIAQRLFEEMKANGEIPAEAKPGEPIGGTVPVDPEPFVAKARAVRGTDAQKIARAFKDFNIPSSDLVHVTPPQWSAVAKSLGVDFPASQVAQSKLIRETGARLRELEAQLSESTPK